MEAGFAVALESVEADELSMRRQLVLLFSDVCNLRDRSLAWHAHRLLLLHKEEAQRSSITLMRCDWDDRVVTMMRKAKVAVGLRQKNLRSTRGKYFGWWAWVCLGRQTAEDRDRRLRTELLIRCTVVGRLGYAPLSPADVTARVLRKAFRLWARFRYMRIAMEALEMEESSKRSRVQQHEATERSRRVLCSVR